MLEPTALREIAGAIGVASALIETKFLQVGQRLESSIEILARLTASLGELHADLESEDLRRAMLSLSQAARRVTEIGRAGSGDHATLDRLHRLLDGIAGRLEHMHKAVKDVDALAINAKIASSDISVAGMDFGSFAKEISRTLQLTRRALDTFGAELRGVRARVAAASSARGCFERKQEEAVRSIPARITDAIDALVACNGRAAATTATIGERSELIRQRVGSAIVALQIGDATRQRLEHAGHGLGFLLEALASAEVDGSIEKSNIEQRHDLIGATSPVFSALVSDAAAHFEHDVRSVTGSLGSLATDARALRQLARSTYGASERNHQSFVVELEEQLSQALVLFEGFGRARNEASEVIGSVSGAAESLTGHLDTVRSLEADIRIMALNATLKCARVGEEGRALGVIAQELRAYANFFATEAGALMSEVASVGAASRTLSQTDGNDTASLSTIAETVTISMSQLRKVGAALDASLGGLEDDGARIELLLEETVASVTGRDEIRAALARAAAGLSEIVQGADAQLSELSPAAQEIIAALERSYTMASERQVHGRVFGTTRLLATSDRSLAPEVVDDALF